MTDFVLEQKKLKIMRLAKLHRIEKYANFLKQPLELWMFVPCNENGNVFEEPIYFELWQKYGSFTQHGEKIVPECIKYQQAKERCLFENEFNDLHNIFLLNDICTIEYLVKYNLQLTQTVIKYYL